MERMPSASELPDGTVAEALRPTPLLERGRDVDPHTEEHSDYALSCRVLRTEAGTSGQPDERWVREALLREARSD
jgi:hypothetical protein